MSLNRWIMEKALCYNFNKAWEEYKKTLEQEVKDLWEGELDQQPEFIEELDWNEAKAEFLADYLQGLSEVICEKEFKSND